MKNLQKRRLDKDLTQNELAKKTGLALSTIRAYEQGQKIIENASLTNILKLCEVLECDIDRLIDNPDTINIYYKIIQYE